MPDQPPSVVDEEIRASRDTLGLPDAAQLPLLPGEVPGVEAAEIVRQYRGRGRPPGSTNRVNKDFRKLVLAQHSHPGLALARVYDRPVELLAAELNCSLADAAALQMRAAAELLPYIEGKAPITVDVRRRNDVVLIMPGHGIGDEQLEGMQRAIDASAEEIDWTTAEPGDVLQLTSFSGVAQGDVSPEAGD